MVAFPRFQGLTASIPPFAAPLAGVAAALSFAFMPTPALENMVWTSGVAALVPAAEPPLGVTARAVLALAGGAVVAAVVWSALYLLFGPGGYLYRAPKGQPGAPALRRADAHPDAPPRKPMSAADLGTPLMEVGAEPERKAAIMDVVAPAERTVPADLDTPLSTFDPEAIPAASARPIASSMSLEPGERMTSFELMPRVRFGEPEDSVERRPEPSVTPSLEQLIRRLEQGAQRRAAHS